MFLGPTFLDSIAAKLEGLNNTDVAGYEELIPKLRGIWKLLLGGGWMQVRPGTQGIWCKVRDEEHIMATYGMAEAFDCLAMADGNTGSHITPVSRVLRLVISNTLGRYTYDFDLQGSCGRRQQHATFKASGYGSFVSEHLHCSRSMASPFFPCGLRITRVFCVGIFLRTPT